MPTRTAAGKCPAISIVRSRRDANARTVNQADSDGGPHVHGSRSACSRARGQNCVDSTLFDGSLKKDSQLREKINSPMTLIEAINTPPVRRQRPTLTSKSMKPKWRDQCKRVACSPDFPNGHWAGSESQRLAYCSQLTLQGTCFSELRKISIILTGQASLSVNICEAPLFTRSIVPARISFFIVQFHSNNFLSRIRSLENESGSVRKRSPSSISVIARIGGATLASRINASCRTRTAKFRSWHRVPSRNFGSFASGIGK